MVVNDLKAAGKFGIGSAGIELGSSCCLFKEAG